ncbi:hypothetical protein Hanom_Chr10g00904981 [Helianthus anomalus]
MPFSLCEKRSPFTFSYQMNPSSMCLSHLIRMLKCFFVMKDLCFNNQGYLAIVEFRLQGGA